MRPSARTVLIIAVSLVVPTACGPSEPFPDDNATVGGDVGGLTREQIEEHAEAMSPEVAESLGIIDTTIRIESPMPAESVRPPTLAPDSIPPR